MAVTAVTFISKLRMRQAATAEAAASAASAAPTQPSSPGRLPGELSWTAKRKQAYLRKYGRERKEAAAQADVAVSAVVFGAKLKRLSTAAKAAAKGEEPVALM